MTEHKNPFGVAAIYMPGLPNDYVANVLGCRKLQGKGYLLPAVLVKDVACCNARGRMQRGGAQRLPLYWAILVSSQLDYKSPSQKQSHHMI
jgi:hypothetical protein